MYNWIPGVRCNDNVAYSKAMGNGETYIRHELVNFSSKLYFQQNEQEQTLQ